jgi:DNA-binding transcriptional LysR family regulator
MELRHLRYFVAVGEALNLTRAASQLRLAQPGLSRQIQDLEEEIGVDLLQRSTRGVALTAEGKLFLEEARDLLARAEDSIRKVRALARGEYGELNIGYSPLPTSQILPPALVAFQKSTPDVKVVLHDLAGDEQVAQLLAGRLELAVMVQQTGEQLAGFTFETLKQYPYVVAMPVGHRFQRLKAVPLETLAAEPLVALRRREYSEFYRILDRIFAGCRTKPKVAVECDGTSSLIASVESGRGVAIVSSAVKDITGRRLAYRPLAGCTEAQSVGIGRAVKGDVTPAGEKFCEILRKMAEGAKTGKRNG